MYPHSFRQIISPLAHPSKQGFPASSAIVVKELEFGKVAMTINKINARNRRVRRIGVTLSVKAALVAQSGRERVKSKGVRGVGLYVS